MKNLMFEDILSFIVCTIIYTFLAATMLFLICLPVILSYNFQSPIPLSIYLVYIGAATALQDFPI